MTINTKYNISQDFKQRKSKMTKLSQTITILHFIGRSIEEIGLTLINFGFDNLYKGIEKERIKRINELGIDKDLIDSEKMQNFIESDVKLISSLVYDSISKGIIDLNSFKDEYDNCFTVKKEENKILADKIIKFKKENKDFIDNVDWVKVNKLRNSILAHNLRDAKKNNDYAVDTLKMYFTLILDHKKCIEYFSLIGIVYNNLKNDFQLEYKNAFIELIENSK